MGSETCLADITICTSLCFAKEENEQWKGITPWNDGDGESTLESFKPYEKIPQARAANTQFHSGDSFDKHDAIFLRRRLKTDVLLTTTWWR